MVTMKNMKKILVGYMLHNYYEKALITSRNKSTATTILKLCACLPTSRC